MLFSYNLAAVTSDSLVPLVTLMERGAGRRQRWKEGVRAPPGRSTVTSESGHSPANSLVSASDGVWS